MDGSEVALAALGITGTLSGALIWLLRKLWGQNEQVFSRLSGAIESLDKTLSNSDKNQSKYHSLVMKKLDTIEKNTDRNFNALITKQTVENQTVEHQTVVEEVVHGKSTNRESGKGKT